MALSKEKKSEGEQPRYFKPSDVCQVSGQYRNTTTGKEVTMVKGKLFPPTPGPGQLYKLVDETKH